MHLFLDANALFSDWQRAIWLSLANSDPSVSLFHSEPVLDECFRNLIRLGHLTAEGASRIRQQWMTHAAVNCISAFDAYLPDVRSVHEKDRHVAAAALKVRHLHQAAEVHLLTWNIRDFPRPPLKRVGVIRWSPDEWLTQQFRQDKDRVISLLADSLRLAQRQRTEMGSCLSAYQMRSSGFPQTADQWPDFLKRTGFRQLGNAMSRLDRSAGL